ncbi:MAG: succinate dehydrogenase assembly factor 2 [Hyphomicrobiales bacterium]|uniref:FAD assembly factor SdhE n=1 Tax=Rhabdaerophilum calidifontis TaxID=2604328 RepID=UPI00123C010E|nr:succinate dehydrogenase assembly factor 2 [Rhabdaerophilum calidifontis]MCA1952905.1 succinate dehydrogenase assembly factor 2 [Hyphomicrobiales bacterium]MCA1999877.1 succinate dehydrogenase assembly factor 2 [Hyphomicrobiales bacterium]
MTGLSRTSADLDPRRKRILFRAWHRGTREMDLLMGRYVESAVAALAEPELAILEALIEVPDRDLFAWLTGAEPVPENYDSAVFRALKAFHSHDAPLDL